jgi:hypothetical protein
VRLPWLLHFAVVRTSPQFAIGKIPPPSIAFAAQITQVSGVLTAHDRERDRLTGGDLSRSSEHHMMTSCEPSQSGFFLPLE